MQHGMVGRQQQVHGRGGMTSLTKFLELFSDPLAGARIGIALEREG